MITKEEIVRYLTQVLRNEYDAEQSDSWNLAGWHENKARIAHALNIRYDIHLSFHDLDYNNLDQFLNHICYILDVDDSANHPSKEELNIIITGKSGAGKSSFLNYLIGEEHFKVGEGAPVTQAYFEDYEYVSPDTHVKYHLYDTKGIEPTTTYECKHQVLNEINRRDKLGMFEWIHTVYYCFDASAKRIQPFEVEFINELKEHASIVVLLTKKDLVSKNDLDQLIAQIKKEVDTTTQVIPVCSVEKRTRKGLSIQEGREDVLRASFLGLWNKLANTYPQKQLMQLNHCVKMNLWWKLDEKQRKWYDSYPTLKNDIDQFDKTIISIPLLRDYPKWDDFPHPKFILMGLIEKTNIFLYLISRSLSNIDVDKVWEYNERIHHQVFTFYQKVNKVKPKVLYTNETKNALINLRNYNLQSIIPELECFQKEIENLWEKYSDAWIFDSSELAALINCYNRYRSKVVEVGNALNLKMNNFLSAYRTELLQYGNYCIRKEMIKEEANFIDSEEDLDNYEKIFYDVVCICLADRKIEEKERFVLDSLLKVLNISFQRAGLIEDLAIRMINNKN